MSDDARRVFLDGLPGRLAEAVGAPEIDAATLPPEGAGIARRLEPALLWVGMGRLPSPIPRVVLDVEPPVDARALCESWGIARPVALSGDVHQSRWSVEEAGAELPDPYERRIATRPFRAGRWDIGLELVARPPGGLPELVAGASPAYDVLERGGEVRRVEVEPGGRRSEIVRGDHADAGSLLGAMAAFRPAWRRGWTVAPDADVVVVYDDALPVAGAAIADGGGGTFLASRLCLPPDRRTGWAGSTLLDVLEAVALSRGGARLRLDDSAFLQGADLPYRRHGYTVGPPYEGDADAPAWAERDLIPPGV